MSTANEELYEELKSKMDKFFATATPNDIKKSFEGIDVQALLRTSSELSGSWTMLFQEAPGPLNTAPLGISEEMVGICHFMNLHVLANNNTLALAA